MKETRSRKCEPKDLPWSVATRGVEGKRSGLGGGIVCIRKPNEAVGAFLVPDIQNPETVEQGGLKAGIFMA